jgi:flotillin
MELTTSQIVIGLVAVGSVFVVVTGLALVSRFFRRCGADEALVRTGTGGNKVVIGGGVMVYPILHQLMRVTLRSVKLSVEREGKNALVTADKIKANVTTELYIKVEPLAEDVLAAARSFGERNLNEEAIADLIEGKLTDALRSVAANQTFMNLHSKRKEFAEMIQATLSEELKKNGLTLENVSITSLSMVPVTDLDPADVFDAEGLRAITESVQTNREKTNAISRQKENEVHAQNVTARMRALELEQAQKQAEADQTRRVAEYAAHQSSETAKAVLVEEQSRELAAYEKQQKVEQGRIAQEQAVAVALAQKSRAEREAQIAAEEARQAAEIRKLRTIEAATIEKDKIVQAAEIDRQKALEAATIEKEKVVGASLVDKEREIEVSRKNKEIAVTQAEEALARAAASRAEAQAEEERAVQSITMVEATAQAERVRAIRVIEASAEAEERRIAAQARAQAAIEEADAIRRIAEAERQKGLALAEARRAMVEAENAIGDKLLLRDVTTKALEVAPEVVRELMSPAQKISEIKVLQAHGLFGGGPSSDGAGLGAMSPIMKTIMEAGAAYPLVRELMAFGKVDRQAMPDKVRELLGEIAPALGDLVQGKSEGSAPALSVGSDTGAIAPVSVPDPASK